MGAHWQNLPVNVLVFVVHSNLQLIDKTMKVGDVGNIMKHIVSEIEVKSW